MPHQWKFRITKGRTLGRKALDDIMRLQLAPLGVRRCVVDIGGKHSPYQKFVHAGSYWTLDIVERSRPDVLCDAHWMPIRSDSVDLVLASQTLEHCEVPQRIVDEVWRVLRSGGVAVCSVPFVHIIHGDPCDYWRFTRYALEALFKRFSTTQVLPVGNQFTATWDLVTAGSSLLRYLNYVMYPLVFSSDGRCPSGYVVVAGK